MEKEDLPRVVGAWNESFVLDKVDEQRFEQIVFDDPNYDPRGTLVAVEGETIVGFVCCAAREGIAGKDGRGTDRDKDNAFLKGMFFRDEGVAEPLLQRAEQFARSCGKRTLKAVEYHGGKYFFPGIDPRYERLIAFLRKNQFQEIARVQNMSLDLATYRPGQGQYQRRQWDRLNSAGIRVVRYRPGMLPQMRAFVKEFNTPGWFGQGWEQQWNNMDRVVVAVRGEQVLGFACYWPPTGESGRAGFGPIGTLERERGRGIGSCMMDECMRRTKAEGARIVIAGWANAPFYIANGWQVCRDFCVLQKGI